MFKHEHDLIYRDTDALFSLATFEHQLVMYVTATDKANFAKAFDMSAVPVVTHAQALAEERTKKLTTATPTLKAPSAGVKKLQVNGTNDKTTSDIAITQKYTQQLMAIPELKAYGNVLKSSQLTELTESETEYVVSAVKHIYDDHIVLQYDVKNTLQDTVLTDVSVVATPSDEDESLEEEFTIPISKLITDEPGTVYVSFRKVTESTFPVTSFTNVLKFMTKEIDPSSGEPDENGFEDEYEVEDLELLGSDYILPAFAGSFDHVWEQTGANGDEASETLQLSNVKSIAGKPFEKQSYYNIVCIFYKVLTCLLDATEQLAKALSLQPLDGTDVALSTSTHTLKLYGKSISGGKVAAIIKMAYSAKSGVTLKITARSEEDGIAALVVGSVT